MNLSLATKLIRVAALPGVASLVFLNVQGIDTRVAIDAALAGSAGQLTAPTEVPLSVWSEAPVLPTKGTTTDMSLESQTDTQSPAYTYGNPAGCQVLLPDDLTAEQLLANVQNQIGSEYNLAERRQTYIWNGELGIMLDITNDPYVYEFVFNDFQHPLTYRGDRVATLFMVNGFVVWLRAYGGNFRLLAIPMVKGVLESRWSSYVTAYWQKNGSPNDASIYPVMKKLPCHWVIDEGYVTNETVADMFDLDPSIPDYLSAGRQYLAGTCKDANRVSREMIGHWDATSMCGPLAWTIMEDVNGFPYRIGSWSKDAGAFIGANPRWNGQPWGTFDPETFTLTHVDSPMAGYRFNEKGNLYPGDLIYSYATLYVTPGYFDHIFVVAGINENGTRLSVSNMVRNAPYADCSIEEVQLYTPGDRETGVINHEWNGFNFGRTGTTGFDIFRWNWIAYHVAGKSISYVIRWGDTIETIAFDWKVSPQSILEFNQLTGDVQFAPGQVITLPVPHPPESGSSQSSDFRLVAR